MQTLHVIHFTLSREMRCRPKADKIRELWLFLAAALFSLWGEYRLMHSALKIPWQFAWIALSTDYWLIKRNLTMRHLRVLFITWLAASKAACPRLPSRAARCLAGERQLASAVAPARHARMEPFTEQSVSSCDAIEKVGGRHEPIWSAAAHRR